MPQYNPFKKSFKSDYVKMLPREAQAAVARGEADDISWDDDGEAWQCFTTAIGDEVQEVAQDINESLLPPSFTPRS